MYKPILLILFCLSIFSCKKEGQLTIKNKSSNPYALTFDGETQPQIPGNTTLEYDLEAGIYQLRAEQVSGYAFFPTVVNSEIEMKKGSEILWEIP